MSSIGVLSRVLTGNDDGGDDDEYVAHAEHAHDEIAVFAPIFLLTMGAVVRTIQKASHDSPNKLMQLISQIPYTVVLLLLGAVIGFGLRVGWEGRIADSHRLIDSMQPHLLLHVFLPPLIFESAFSVEWHIFDKAKTQMLLLAGPGMLISTFALGAVINGLMASFFANDDEHVWPRAAGNLLGGILSATDPVAVVALLKDVGVKADLSTAIEGESLLNDGTALVVFVVVLEAVQDTSFSPGAVEVVSEFVRMSLGGVTFGILIGCGCVVWLSYIFNDALVEITITVAASYLAFFVSEVYFEVSGVLAVVALGLFMGWAGRTRISPEVQHFLKEFWELLAYFGNTLVFCIAGMVVATRELAIVGDDWLILLIVYIACLVVRFFTVFGTGWFLQACGTPQNPKDLAVSTWGGLRGAVGLALALIVAEDQEISRYIGDRVLLHTCGIVVLTVVVNGVSMRYLISALGMDRISEARQRVFEEAMNSLRKAGHLQETSLRREQFFTGALWDEVRRFYFVPPVLKVERTSQEIAGRKAGKLAAEVKEARRRVLMICKSSYWTQFKDGLLGQHALKRLVDATDSAIDNDCSLKEWDELKLLMHLDFDEDDNALGPGGLQRTRTLFGTTGLKGHRKPASRRTSLNMMHQGAQSQKISPMLALLSDTINHPGMLVGLIMLGILPVIVWGASGGGAKSNAADVTLLVVMVVFVIELFLRGLVASDWSSVFMDFFLCVDILSVGMIVWGLTGSTLGAAGYFMGMLRLLRIFGIEELTAFCTKLCVCSKKISPSAPKRNDLLAADHENLKSPGTSTTRTGVEEMQRLWSTADATFSQRMRVRLQASQLQYGFDVASGFLTAREECMHLLSDMFRDSETQFAGIKAQLQKDARLARTALFDMQHIYSEIAASITTAMAARTVLNKQRRQVEQLEHEGLLDVNESEHIRGAVEYQMKRLQHRPPVVQPPTREQLISQISWLESIPTDQMEPVYQQFKDMYLDKGAPLARFGDHEDAVYVIARGTAAVKDQEGNTVANLGIGSVLGEIGWATKEPRGADIVTTSPALVLTVQGDALHDIATTHPTVGEELWNVAGRRMAENMWMHDLGQQMTLRDVRETLATYYMTLVRQATEYTFRVGAIVFLVKGVAAEFAHQTSREDTSMANDKIEGVAAMLNAMDSNGDLLHPFGEDDDGNGSADGEEKMPPSTRSRRSPPPPHMASGAGQAGGDSPGKVSGGLGGGGVNGSSPGPLEPLPADATAKRTRLTEESRSGSLDGTATFVTKYEAPCLIQVKPRSKEFLSHVFEDGARFLALPSDFSFRRFRDQLANDVRVERIYASRIRGPGQASADCVEPDLHKYKTMVRQSVDVNVGAARGQQQSQGEHTSTNMAGKVGSMASSIGSAIRRSLGGHDTYAPSPTAAPASNETGSGGHASASGSIMSNASSEVSVALAEANEAAKRLQYDESDGGQGVKQQDQQGEGHEEAGHVEPPNHEEGQGVPAGDDEPAGDVEKPAAVEAAATEESGTHVTN